jgi:hypothetical protein
MELGDSNPRPPGCDASAALARPAAAVFCPPWSVDGGLVDGGACLAAQDGCVCGVHVWRSGGPHSWRSRVILSQPAEPTGAVKARPSGPSVASREAGALTVGGWWS